jgi:hypothetical protein
MPYDVDTYEAIMEHVEHVVLLEGELYTLPWNASRRHASALEICEALLQSRRLALSTGNQTIISALDGMLDLVERSCPRELAEVKGRAGGRV